MKLGQTSVIHFGSRLLASAFGFIATVYFARLLGPGPIGTYYLVISLVSWFGMIGTIGFSAAMTKRISEGEDQSEFVVAGVVLVGMLLIFITLGLLAGRSVVNDYIGYPAVPYLLVILFMTLGYGVLTSVLDGLRLVHITGPLSTLRTGLRSLFQVGALVIGLELVGLFVGYIAAFALVVLLGSVIALRHVDNIALPERRHFRDLLDYAKFAWIGNLQSKMFNHTDIIVLGFFVPSALVGIYSIAWNIGQFLILFAGSLRTALFPEMSGLAADNDLDTVESIVEGSLVYAGLLMIPGLVGGIILGERILRIYGQEFTQGATVLVLLIAANLVMSYQSQLLNTLNALDRPDLSFRVNGLFVICNISLNIIFVYLYGWLGAAVATVCSVSISVGLAYHYLENIIDVAIPVDEISRQGVAALLMGGVVYICLRIERTYTLLGRNIAVLVVLVGSGAAIYVLTLLALSPRFRMTVEDNLPFELPMLW